ncbi:hypothetical protein M9M90_16075 [Phenylobacterium sp. LH3H17]|uniref:hypothetical protein n=1 Tax=Phenylobacterium sp. LH3H17 TaxID=2903901 RepID=UPI0020C9E64F|nr:hypothetical protein [Phenylobacterium sp. LH3H17]UTP38729.1 hypothetical protein M9M90_16075 [Phenylobacterium sp. LH3H17]
MRLGLLIVALASASPAAAQMAGDRYGDRSPTAAAAAIGASYDGPTLSWSRKTQPASPVAGGLPPAPRIQRGPEPRAYQPFQPQTPIPLQWSAPKANLPGTLYDTPPAAAAQQIAATPPPAPAAQAQPMRLAAVAPSPALLGGPPATVASTPRGAGGATRLYSVHRGYGLTPDAIPQQPGGDRYVLIGPPDADVQASPKPDDDGPDDGPGVF